MISRNMPIFTHNTPFWSLTLTTFAFILLLTSVPLFLFFSHFPSFFLPQFHIFSLNDIGLYAPPPPRGRVAIFQYIHLCKGFGEKQRFFEAGILVTSNLRGSSSCCSPPRWRPHYHSLYCTSRRHHFLGKISLISFILFSTLDIFLS
jgi:hypothetical protein